ncbi:MAG: hypothetical protein ACXVWW_03055 [Nocardioides sp.]
MVTTGLTRAEQAEADAYERRRLVDALVAVSGETHRVRGGAAVASVVLGVLLVAGYGIRALLTPGPPTTASACTADGAGVAVAARPARAVVTASGTGAVVSADGLDAWLVAMDGGQHAARYRVPRGSAGDTLLTTAGLPPVAQAVRVPPQWLMLLPEQGTLAGDTWVRSHWASATLQPLAALVCAELVLDAPAPYVRLATRPAQASWTAPPPGQVTRDVDPSLPARDVPIPTAWRTLIGR